MAQNAKSAKLQLLEGNPNKKNTIDLRKRAEQEEKLKMLSDKIKAPKWLDKDAKKVFKFVKAELMSIDLITNGDIHTIALYSDWYVQYVKFQEAAKELPKDYGPNGYLKQMDMASKQIRAYAADLGLSPSARAKLAIKLAENESNDENDY